MDVVKAIRRGTSGAILARPGLFVTVAGATVVLSIMLPPVVLSMVRKPWTYFAFNPWLKSLPSYLASDAVLRQNSVRRSMREAFDYGQRADAAISDLQRKNSRLGVQEKNEYFHISPVGCTGPEVGTMGE
jgi:hypothetical protein